MTRDARRFIDALRQRSDQIMAQWRRMENRALFLDGKSDRTPEEDAELSELARRLSADV